MAVRKSIFTFGTALSNSPNGAFLGNSFDQNTLVLDTMTLTPTKVVAKDNFGASIEIYGRNLKLGTDGSATGTVTKVVFLDSAKADLMTVTNLNLHAGKLLSAYSQGDMWSMMSLLSKGNDVIKGTDGHDDIMMGDNAGNDVINAGNGDDYVRGSAGNNIIIGGLGDDALSFEETFFKLEAYQGIILNAAKGTVINSWGGRDKISGFETYVGSIYSDVFIGSKADETFSGMRGADIIKGGAGYDFAVYGMDENYGGNSGIVANLAAGLGVDKHGTIVDGFGFVDEVTGIEAVIGTNFDDTFIGDAADNRFKGGVGKDNYDGGAGTDMLDFRSQVWGNDPGINVDLTLATEQVIDDGFGNTETAMSIESIRGSFRADLIKLGAADGNVRGYDGNDRITAGLGVNQLEGGAGADTFIYLSLDALTNGGKVIDTITDFETGTDKIDLSLVATGLSFTGTAFSGGGNEVIAFTEGNSTRIEIDLNGDKVADAALYLGANTNLVATDFIFTIT